jgi:adiponectin receptor
MIITNAYVIPYVNPNATIADHVILSVFLIAAQLQMAFSTIFHLFGCCSPSSHKMLARLDYTGISIMIVGSNYPPMYFG